MLVELALRERPPRAEVLLFVDQLEELFADAVTDRHPRCFVGCWWRPRRRVVSTRSPDAGGLMLAWRLDLVEVLRGGTFPLAVPTGPALIEMMTGPARCAGLTFEPDLLDRIGRTRGRSLAGSPSWPSRSPSLTKGERRMEP